MRAPLVFVIRIYRTRGQLAGLVENVHSKRKAFFLNLEELTELLRTQSQSCSGCRHPQRRWR